MRYREIQVSCDGVVLPYIVIVHIIFNISYTIYVINMITYSISISKYAALIVDIDQPKLSNAKHDSMDFNIIK